jgi:pimeloyl-ACP methyl ester carboxylesterase
MGPTVDALARWFRVITFPLCDERAWRGTASSAPGLDAFAHQVETVLDARAIERAVICGVSFGGRVALRFAARYPSRTAALVLVSTPGPRWHLRKAHQFYTRQPLLCAPLFLAGAPLRLWHEIASAIPDRRERRRFVWRQIFTLLSAPVSPTRMAARARLIADSDPTADCRAVNRPTLVISGDPGLDHVVAVGGTLEYEPLIEGIRMTTIERTGHLGCITRPEAFASAVRDFVRAA